MRILALPKYGRLGASSRLRTFQYLPYFAAAGFEVTVHSLLGDRYLSAFYGKTHALGEVLSGYLGRLAALVSARRYDVVWLEKDMLPWLPYILESQLLPRSTRLVVDYDDAVFHRYDQHRIGAVRWLLGSKHDHLMRRADLVIAGNGYLRQHAESAGCKNIAVVPTVVDLDRYVVRPDVTPREGPVRIGWIGSPYTARYLAVLSATISDLVDSGAVEFVAIGARAEQLSDPRFKSVEWSEETEVSNLSSFDIGIMPLPDEPFERGKCGYKLIQYMACGLPVVASPVGVNQTIVRDGENGFLASSDSEWKAHLLRLIRDEGLRRALGAAGRSDVDSIYSIQAQGPRVVALLDDLHRP